MKHIKKRAQEKKKKKERKEKGRKRRKTEFQGTVGNIKHFNMYKWSQSRESEGKTGRNNCQIFKVD